MTIGDKYYIAQAWSVVVSCRYKMTIPGISKMLIKLKGPKEMSHLLNWFDYSQNTIAEDYYAAGEIVNAMAMKLKWDRSLMDWIGFALTDGTIHMVLVDLFELELTPRRLVVYDMKEKIRQINEATAMGLFDELKLSDGTIFSVAETAGCNNDDCTDLYDVTTTTANVASSRVSHEPMPFLCMTLLTLNLYLSQ